MCLSVVEIEGCRIDVIVKKVLATQSPRYITIIINIDVTLKFQNK